MCALVQRECLIRMMGSSVAKLLNKDNKIAFNKVREELSEIENGKCLL